MTLFIRRALVVLSFVCLIGAPGTTRSFAQARALVTFEKSALAIKTKTGRHDFNVEIARRPRQQAQGLMFRRKLAANAGMLFLYRNSEPARMWMKNTNIPLDLLYINGVGKIVGFHQRSVPHSLEVITSKQPINAVLEVNAGTVSRLQIEVGDRVIHRAFQTK